MTGPDRPRAARCAWLGIPVFVALCSCWAGGPGGNDGPFPVVQAVETDGAKLELAIDQESLTTAQSALLRLEVESEESDTVQFPDSQDGFGEFAVVRDEALPTRMLDDGRVSRSREYVLQPFLPGDYELPPLEVTLNGSVKLSTEPVDLVVESVLEDEESPELRDITEPFDIPAPWWWWAALGVSLAAALAGLAWWWKRRKHAMSVPRPVPPHEAALGALDALLADNLISEGRYQLFFLRLSDIVRHYVEERFGLRAPERTTEEFLAEMAAAPVIRKDHQKLLRGFLHQADMVKFAKFLPAEDEVGGAVNAARRFIRQTVPDEPLAGQDGQGQRPRASK